MRVTRAYTKTNRRYCIRDQDTKKVLSRNGRVIEFNELNSAITIMATMRFGLNNFYEIYDRKNNRIINYKELYKTK